ncbi:MAG UNVERIFIED_CONTAM: hypothetical protein LVR18_18495 [Planctomycetaceae bacterium]
MRKRPAEAGGGDRPCYPRGQRALSRIHHISSDGREFLSKRFPSSQLQLDGSFRMRTWPWGDGVPPGSYRVTLSPELAGRIDRSRYGDVRSTPLSITVPQGALEGHEFRVDER